jgi:hypothetical protein
MLKPVADAINTRTCTCRRQWDYCPCQSNGKYGGVDEKYYSQLKPDRGAVVQK